MSPTTICFVNVVVIRYKGKVQHVQGIEESSSNIMMSLPEHTTEAVLKDEETLKHLPPHFARNLSGHQPGAWGYMGESEAYHFAGTYGNLSISVEQCKVEVKNEN
jgi:hypothetical protein